MNHSMWQLAARDVGFAGSTAAASGVQQGTTWATRSGHQWRRHQTTGVGAVVALVQKVVGATGPDDGGGVLGYVGCFPARADKLGVLNGSSVAGCIIHREPIHAPLPEPITPPSATFALQVAALAPAPSSGLLVCGHAAPAALAHPCGLSWVLSRNVLWAVQRPLAEVMEARGAAPSIAGVALRSRASAPCAGNAAPACRSGAVGGRHGARWRPPLVRPGAFRIGAP